MKPILLTLLLMHTCLVASEIFLLPDNTTDALYFMAKSIASAEQNITIVTPDLHSNSIRKSLPKSFKKGAYSTIITQELPIDDAAYLAQFKPIKVMIIKGLQSDYRQGRLRLSMLLVDEKYACISTVAFNEEIMRQDIAMIECTSDPQRLKHYMHIVKTLIDRSDNYL